MKREVFGPVWLVVTMVRPRRAHRVCFVGEQPARDTSGRMGLTGGRLTVETMIASIRCDSVPRNPMRVCDARR